MFRSIINLYSKKLIKTSIHTASRDFCDISKAKRPDVKALLDNAASFEDEQAARDENEWSTSPYPKGATSRNQAFHSFRPRVDPRETSIILFPGQGTQYVGMGSDLVKFPGAKDLFEAASSVLSYDLLKLCTNGPAEKLNRTEYAQPAILVCSLAALERLKEERPSAIENCVGTAGFSLGELAALVFAEVMSFETAVKLVKIRAEAMQLSSEMIPGAMVNVLYGPDSELSKACAKAKEYAQSLGVENACCAISNYLFPHGKIVAGNEEAIKYLEDNKKEFKLRKLKRLPVSGAFHTPLMLPAVETFRAALSKVRLSDPAIAVHSNVDGRHYRDSAHVRRQLPKQIVAPVKWEQTMHILYERTADMPFPNTFECGPGQTLSVILKMVNTKAWGSCQNVPA
ncbi:malonyl-CoA-acyl carrier protein transacylase beg [Rhodnius prolixus]|uniref:malonyl-CoA-acyl carrier protein transacylase beg n=1 Tax=Rhodnius prolixus TaxID=13249 RepID=UPI003D18A900